MSSTQTVPNQERPEVKKATGLIRIWNALLYSLDGFRAAFKYEAAFRQEVILAAILIPLAAFLPSTLTQKALLIGSVILILIVELLNSAVEWVVDYVSTNRHPFAKRAKDMGSAAVLFALVNCSVVWTLIIIDNWIQIRNWVS